MNAALRLMVARIGTAVTIAAAVACVSPVAVAGYVVDTGEPVGFYVYEWPLFNVPIQGHPHFDRGFNEVGGSFALTSAQTLTAVEGFIVTIEPGDVMVSLWSGAPTISGAPLFTTRASVGGVTGWPGHWKEFGGLDWAVGPGIYTVTFAAVLGFQGTMSGGAPTPLLAYYERGPDGPDPMDDDWKSFEIDRRPTFNAAKFGMRVTAIPEPETYALMLAGLGILGVAARRRKGC